MSEWTVFGEDWSPQMPETETYDPTWPYNWKWAYNWQSGEVAVWRAKGGIDGRPTHRAEVRRLWGRNPEVVNGDVMGLATYKPAEMRLDGTVVAPALIKIQTYYGMPTPPAVYNWFNENFPDVQVTDAVIRAPKTQIFGKVAAEDWDFDNPPAGYTGKTIKWAYNDDEEFPVIMWEVDGPDGSPWHQEAIPELWGRRWSPADLNGTADKMNTSLLVNSYRRLPVKALQAVKTELAKRYPDLSIDTSNVITDTEEPSFHDPQNIQTVTKAAIWMRKQLAKNASVMPLYAPESDSKAIEVDTQPSTFGATEKGLWSKVKHWFGKGAATGADMDGCMIALFLPEDKAKELRVRGGEPVEQMHVTLIYFQEKANERSDWDDVERIVEQFANQRPEMEGSINGYGVFYNDQNVLWATPSVKGLAELRSDLVEAVEEAGFPVSDEHDWVPHITLKYDFRGSLPELDEPIKLKFDSLSFAQGEDQKHFKFEGAFDKTTVWQYPDHPDVMYHGSPRHLRDSIIQNGLVPNQPSSEYPRGVFLATDAAEAADWAYWRGEKDGDVWEVNTRGLTLEMDPNSYNQNGEDDNYYTTDPIGPERLRLVPPREKITGMESQSSWETPEEEPQVSLEDQKAGFDLLKSAMEMWNAPDPTHPKVKQNLERILFTLYEDYDKAQVVLQWFLDTYAAEHDLVPDNQGWIQAVPRR